MASVYRKKNNRIYISYYDQTLGKCRDRSTGLIYNKKNLKVAKEIAKQLQAELNKQSENLSSLGIERVTIQLAFDHFKRINSNKHKKTIYEYDWFYKRFSEAFNPDAPCTIITKVRVEEWLANLRKLNYQRNSLYNYAKILKKFIGFLNEYNYCPPFKINRDVLIRPEVKAITIFSEPDIIKFFNGLSDKNSNFRTTMALMFYTGLRPSDIYNIRVEDIDFDKNMMRYYSQKTDDHNLIPIHPDLISILKDRCEEVQNGRLLDYDRIDSIGKAFRRYLDKIKLTGKNYTLRTFRKTFITTAHDSGMDLATVSKLVGHHDISTTARYYNKLSLNKQAQELNKLKLKTQETQMNEKIKNEYLNKIIEKFLPDELMQLVLMFFSEEDHQEISRFLYSKIENSVIVFPGTEFFMIKKLLERLLKDIDNLHPDDFEKYL